MYQERWTQFPCPSTMPTNDANVYMYLLLLKYTDEHVESKCLRWLPSLSHLSHHRRLDSPVPKYNQSWCPDEHVGSIVYGDYPPPDALLALSQHRWQPVPAPPPPPPPHKIFIIQPITMYMCIARLAKSPSTRDNNALCVLLFTAQIDFCTIYTHVGNFFWASTMPVPPSILWCLNR